MTYLTVDDDEELAACGALAGEGLSRFDLHVLGHLRQLAELPAREVGEEGQRPSASAFVSWEKSCTAKIYTRR